MTAAAARKLQKDIEVVLKKVEDGMEEFGEVWEQATTATNPAQKEKLGEELKRSINKLQRFRAQIREWIGQNDVKSNCKDKLEEARKKIEQDMQQFKEFERDLKMKAFSTCALAKADDLEIEEAEKVKNQEWLTTTIQTLEKHLEEYDGDLEILNNKKSLSSDEKARSAQIKIWQERHRWHSKKLELLLRALYNDNLDLTDLAVIRESVDVYLECHADQDYYHDEGLYDCFDLAEYEQSVSAPQTPVADSTPAAKDPATPTGKEELTKKGKDKKERKKDEKKDRKREAREEKKAAAGASPASATSKAVGAGTKGDAKTPTSQANGSDSWRNEDKKVLDDINLDEVKVQEDQLLSEAEEFICKICQVHIVGCSPKLTNCSHLFCGDCIAQWFNQQPQTQSWAQRAKSAGSERVVPCPVCKQPLNEKKDLYPVCSATSRSENLLLWRMLSSMKILCANHSKLRSDGACDWVGEYGQYQKHIASCKNLPMAEYGSGATPDAKYESNDVASLERAVPHDRAIEPDRAAHTDTRADRVEHTPERDNRSVVEKATAPTPQSVQTTAPRVAPKIQAQAPQTPAPRVAAPQVAAPKVVATQVAASAPQVVSAQPAPVQAQVATQPQAGMAEQRSVRTPTEVTPRASDAVHAEASDALQPGEMRAGTNFKPTGANMVEVRAGDRIQVLEQHGSGWTYCKNVSRDCTGWAPSWVVDSPEASHAAEPTKSEATVQSEAGALKVDEEAKEPFGRIFLQSGTTSQAAVAAAPTPQQVPGHMRSAEQVGCTTPKAPHTEVRAAQTAFRGASASQLTLAINDLVEIIERHSSGWTYGRKVSPSRENLSEPVEGWFPDWVSEQR
mmetsp:Transcript_103295/g.179202  ORF Transcript_103295/g.179202 Transcript_103295/m.179202 type:complete len:848 (+) Transcript_103295:118-2661(+)